MKIGILFNRQGSGIATALQSMLPGSDITHFLLPQEAATPAQREMTHAALSACDYVVSQLTGGEFGPLSTDELRRAARNFATLPNFDFRGFHPDTIRIGAGGAALGGPTGPYHSRIAVAGFLAGLTPHETAALYHKLAFSRLGYFQTFEQETTRLVEDFARHNLNAVPMMGRLRALGCFMHGIDHPKAAPMMEMARAACALFGLSPVPVALETLPDPLAAEAAHKVFPDIAAAIGIEPEGVFRPATAPGQHAAPLGLQDFVAASFAAFRDARRENLRSADGVAQALADLGLIELSPRNWPAPRQNGMALMTWHATLLRQTNGAEAVHVPINAPDIEGAVLRADIPGDRMPDTLDILGGVAVRPAARAGTVALVRNATFLSADRDSARAWFVRDAAGDWESFLPVTDEQLRILRSLLAGGWAPDGVADAAQARLTSGPAVQFGAGAIDLIGAWPHALAPDEDGVPRLLVMLNGAPAILRQTAPVSAAPDEPRTIAMSQRIILAGADVIQPLPLTLTNAARRWLHASRGDSNGLPWLSKAPRAVLTRAADQRLPGAGANADDETDLPGPLVAVVSALDESGDWAAPLLRLLAMAPHLPPGTAVLAPSWPGAGIALSEAWHCLGLPPIRIVDPPPGIFTARDVTTLDPPTPGAWPAETLLAARAIVLRDAQPGSDRCFLRGPAARAIANLSAVETTLAELDFTIIDCAGTPPAAQLAQLRDAGCLVGVGDDLVASAFCPPGTKIVEITSNEAFRPEAWMLSCRLRFSHGVLPCVNSELGLQVHRKQLAALILMLRFRLN